MALRLTEAAPISAENALALVADGLASRGLQEGKERHLVSDMVVAKGDLYDVWMCCWTLSSCELALPPGVLGFVRTLGSATLVI